MQDSQARQEFVLEQARKQAVQVGQAAIAMPTRVEQMSSTLSSLEGGEIKLRVRALEVERAARRASIMQVCCFFPPIFFAFVCTIGISFGNLLHLFPFRKCHATWCASVIGNLPACPAARGYAAFIWHKHTCNAPLAQAMHKLPHLHARNPSVICRCCNVQSSTHRVDNVRSFVLQV